MPPFPALFAAGDWITIVIMVVFGMVALINKLIKSAAEGQKGPGGPLQPRRPPAKKVDDEIEAFLRRAAQARSGQPPQPAQPPPPFQPPRPNVSPRPSAVPPPIRTPQRPASARPPGSRPMPPPVPTPVPPARPRRTLEPTTEESLGQQSVPDHVSQHMDTRAFAERAAHLTNVDEVAGEMEQHIHQAMDHKLGVLNEEASAQPTAGQPGAMAVPVTAAALGIAQLMASPAQLRNAIIMNEILRRPTDRWE